MADALPIRTAIDGRPCSVVFLDGAMNPVAQEQATYLRALFDDGGSMLAVAVGKDPASDSPGAQPGA